MESVVDWYLKKKTNGFTFNIDKTSEARRKTTPITKRCTRTKHCWVHGTLSIVSSTTEHAILVVLHEGKNLRVPPI
jgi:hypothetical protein